MLQLMCEGCSYTYPPLSIARYTFIQLSEMEQCRVKKLAMGFNTTAQDLNPGSRSRESEALPLSHCAVRWLQPSDLCVMLVVPPPPYAPAPPDDTAQWSCSACTFLNHAQLDKCEMCEMPRINHGTCRQSDFTHKLLVFNWSNVPFIACTTCVEDIHVNDMPVVACLVFSVTN